MEKSLLCPRCEICPVYQIYIDNTGDDSLGIIQVLTMENRDYFSCRAFGAVMKLAQEKKISENTIKRLGSLFNCMLIYEANRMTPKHLSDTG